MSITGAAYQKCINPDCAAEFDCGEAMFKCPKCGELLDALYNWDKIDVPEMSYRQISLLKTDPGRNLLYLGEHIIDCDKNVVTGELPKEVGNVVEHIDAEKRRMYVSHFRLDKVAYQKLNKMTITDADTYKVLQTLNLKRPSGHNLAVDPGLNMVVSKPLVKNLPFYAEVDVYDIG